MLESILRVTGDREIDWTITHENSQERYKRGVEIMQSGKREDLVIVLYTRIFFQNGGGDYSHKVVNEQLGLPKEDLDEATRYTLQLHERGAFDSYK